MAAIRRRDTRPERLLRSILHARGLRYRVDMRMDLPGGRVRPDLVFTRARVAVLVDGCFWTGQSWRKRARIVELAQRQSAMSEIDD